MQKILKNIRLFFMLIAGLIVFSHSLIPHDHHYNLANDLAHEHHNDEDKSSTHCHFLDYVIVDVEIQKSVNRQIVLHPVLFGVLSGFDFEEKSIKQTHFIKSENKPNLLTFIKTSPTRGAPFFS